MLHPLATACASSANELDKSDQLGNPTGPHSNFPLLQAHLPLVLSQQTTKILCKREHHSDGRVTLDKLLQIGRLLSRAALCGSHHHECNTSGRRRLVPDDGLFRDRARSFGTKGAQPHLKCTPRTRVSDAATISLYNLATLWHPWFHREA